MKIQTISSITSGNQSATPADLNSAVRLFHIFESQSLWRETLSLFGVLPFPVLFQRGPMSNFEAFLFGTIVTAIFAVVPFVLSSRQLKTEAERLRHLNEILLNTLEEQGEIRLNRDAKGNIVGRIITMTATGGSFSLSGGLVAIHHKSGLSAH